MPETLRCCGPGAPQVSKMKTFTDLYRPLQILFQRTLTRSWALSGPVRIQSAAELRTRHRARCLEAGDLAGSGFTL